MNTVPLPRAQGPLLAAYRAAGATLEAVHDMLTGIALAAPAGGLYLADLTPLPKLLLVGAQAADALRAAGLSVPALLRAVAGTQGAYVTARAPRQYLVCAAADAGLPALTDEALCYDSVDFALGGGGAAGIDDLLAEGCPIDLAQHVPDAWIPTSLFGVDVALWRVAPGHWRVHAAPADGEFLAATVLDAVRVRHGGLVGYGDYLGALEQLPGRLPGALRAAGDSSPTSS